VTKIILGAILEGISTRSDGTFKVVIGTQEIDKSKVADLFSLVNKYSKILVTDNNVIGDLDEGLVEGLKVAAKKGTKSRSQRLRNVIYRLWEQQGHGEFEPFYDNQMEQLIDGYKEQLNDGTAL
jgi:hypothetical protein